MLELGSGKWSEFEQMTMADTGAGIEEDFPIKSMSEARQSIKDIWGVCWRGRSSGNENWSCSRDRTEWQVRKVNTS